MQITFVVNGDPRGKERARTYTTKRGMVRTITPEKTRNYESLVAWEYKRQCPHTCFIGELEVVINAYYPIPKSWSNKKKQSAVDGEIRPNVTPDCDNIAKAVLDSLNNVAYEDDKTIQDLHIHKHYSNEPRVEVTIIGDCVTV
jgi:Holliday junction resolvase RusA-like endonuclease